MAESGDYDAFDDALLSENQPSNNMYSAQDDGDIVDLYDDVMKDSISYGGYETPSAKRDEDAKNAGDKSDSMLSAPSPAGGGEKPASNGEMAKSGSISTLTDEDAEETNGQANNMQHQAGSDAGSAHSNMPSSVHSASGFQHQQQQQYQRRYAFLVSNLAWWTTEDELEDAIVSLGISDVADIRINDNRQNGQSKGFAVVVVLSEASNRTISRLAEKDLNGQKPVVQIYAKHTLMELDTTGEQRNFGGGGGGMGGNMGGPGRFNPMMNNRFGGPMMMPDRPPMQPMMGGMMMGQGPPGMRGTMGPRGPPMMMNNGGGGIMMRPQMGGGGMNRAPMGGMMQPNNLMMGIRGQMVPGGIGPGAQRMMMNNGGPNNMMMRPGVMGMNMQMMQQPGGGMMLNATGPNVHVNPAFLHQQQQLAAAGGAGGINPQNLVNGIGMPMDPSQQQQMGNNSILTVGADGQQHGVGANGMHNTVGGDFGAVGGAAGAQQQMNHPYGDMMMNAGGIAQHQHQPHMMQQQQQHNTTSQEPTSVSEHGDSSAMSRDEILLRNKSVSSTAISRAWADARSGDYKSAIDTLTTAISIIRRSRVADDERCKILISSLEERLTAIQKEAEEGAGGGSSSAGGGGGNGGGGGERGRGSRSRSRSPTHRRSHRRSRSPGSSSYHKRSSRRSNSRSRSPTSRDRSRRSRDKRSTSRDRYRSSRHRRH